MQHKPKKSLGQNFLVDKNLQKKIIASCGLSDCDTVLEIGSGRGELSRLIAEKVKSLYCLELDRRLCAVLKEEFGASRKVKVINQDVLKFDLSGHFSGLRHKLKVVGNIPYYITTPIIGHLLKYRRHIDTIFLTVQKEFGSRMSALPGSKEYGSLSCFVQYYSQAKVLFTLKNTCFYPSPKVDSCFLRMEIRREPLLSPDKEKEFFRLVRLAFCQRRKTLRNSLKEALPRNRLEAFFERYALSVNSRPEELSPQDFINLVNL